MTARPPILFVGLLIVLAGCVGGPPQADAGNATSHADSSTLTPMPTTPEPTTITSEPVTLKTPSQELRADEREGLAVAIADVMQATSLKQEFPQEDVSSRDQNRTAKAVARYVDENLFSVDKICYTDSIGQTTIIGNATETVYVDGYEQFTVTLRLIVLPAPEGALERPIGRVLTGPGYTCDVELPTPEGG